MLSNNREDKILETLKMRMMEIRDAIGDDDEDDYYASSNSTSMGQVPQIIELLRENILNMKDIIESDHTDYEELYRLKQILEEYNEKLTDSLRISRKQNESLNIKIATMNQKRRDFETKERELDLLIREIQQNSNEMKKKLQNFEKENFELTQKNAEIVQENLEISEENHDQQKRIREMEDDYFNLNEKYLKLQNDYEKKEAEYNSIYERVKMIEERVDENDTDYSQIEDENLLLGEALLSIEKSLMNFKLSMKSFFQMAKNDLPKKSIYKIFYALVENQSLRVKDFKELTKITIPTVYSDIKVLEKMGLLSVKREKGVRYQSYMVSLVLNEE
jgi:chromosome segregation ATPase